MTVKELYTLVRNLIGTEYEDCNVKIVIEDNEIVDYLWQAKMFFDTKYELSDNDGEDESKDEYESDAYDKTLDLLHKDVNLAEIRHYMLDSERPDPEFCLVFDLDRKQKNHFESKIPMNFGFALESLVGGKKIRRGSWKEGKFVYYVPANKYKQSTDVGKSIADKHGYVKYASYFALKEKGKSVQMWMPNTEDCLAKDWELYEN